MPKIYSMGVKAFIQFNNYSINTKQKDIRDLFGLPESKAENLESILNEELVSWDRYRIDKKYLHFEYASQSGNLRLITIMDSKVVSG